MRTFLLAVVEDGRCYTGSRNVCESLWISIFDSKPGDRHSTAH